MVYILCSLKQSAFIVFTQNLAHLQLDVVFIKHQNVLILVEHILTDLCVFIMIVGH